MSNQPAPATNEEAELRLDRETLREAILKFLADRDAHTLREIGDALEREFDEAGAEALVQLRERLAHAGTDWTYSPPDPLARRIHHLLADRILEDGSALVGLEHLTHIVGRPVVIFANHLSYSDANLLEILLQRAGGAALSDRLTVIAGPKVYSHLKRRFSSLCFGTIKTPQNSGVSSEDAVMTTREVARAARRSSDDAHERLRMGDALLVFAEGTRSRTSGMQPLLPGAMRYLDGPDVSILPIGVTGTETLYPIGGETLHPVRIVVRAGPPIEGSVLRAAAGGDRRLMADTIGLGIAHLLPPAYRGSYGANSVDVAEARALMSARWPAALAGEDPTPANPSRAT